MTTRLEEEAQSHWQASHILRGVPLMSPEWKCPQNDLLCLYYRAASLSSLDKASMGTYDNVSFAPQSLSIKQKMGRSYHGKRKRSIVRALTALVILRVAENV